MLLFLQEILQLHAIQIGPFLIIPVKTNGPLTEFQDSSLDRHEYADEEKMMNVNGCKRKGRELDGNPDVSNCELTSQRAPQFPLFWSTFGRKP